MDYFTNTPLVEGRLIKRYKRFLADIELSDGSTMTAHCPNTGSMKHCAQAGARVWFFDANNPKRKLAHTWELVEVDNKYLACINTHRANHLAREAIESGLIASLAGYDKIQTECRYGNENSRIDLLLSQGESPDCYVEVKSVTLLEQDGLGIFPDAVTTRGQKHLRELMEMVSQGYRAVLFFSVAHTGIQAVQPAWEIDPTYARTLKEAIHHGVEVIAVGAEISTQSIRLSRVLPFHIGG